jgi:hypothetical protein
MGSRGRVVTLLANRYLPRLSTGYRKKDQKKAPAPRPRSRPAATPEPIGREAQHAPTR